jgi:squalene cyclase
MARFVLREQAVDGRWYIEAGRPPMESTDIEVTAASMRALQVYAPKAQRMAFESAIHRAAAWLLAAKPSLTEERAFQLLGLAWSHAPKSALDKAARALIAQQRPDGGWSQLPTLASDAYATGEALVALEQSGALAPAEPAYRRGVEFLLRTQLPDGSWHVKSRAIAVQPYFESGFPHGRDQFISAAATNWATMALTAAVKPQS